MILLTIETARFEIWTVPALLREKKDFRRLQRNKAAKRSWNRIIMRTVEAIKGVNSEFGWASFF